MTIALPNIGDADLVKVYYEGLSGLSTSYPLTEKIFNLIPDDKSSATVLYAPDIGLLNPRPTPTADIEDSVVANDYRLTFTHQERARKISVSYADVSDRPEVMSAYANDLAVNTRQTIEGLLCLVVANAFTATAIAKTGELLVQNNHALLGGGTASNRLTVALSHANFATARSMLLFQATDGGGVATTPLAHLIVPKELMETGYQIQNAGATSDQLQPTSYRGTFEVSPLMFATDTDDWFVCGEKGQQSLTAILREAPKFWSHWDEDNMKYNASAYFRMSQGAVDWHGFVGSVV